MILWIDDDNALSLMSYIDELEEGGLEVVHIRVPDQMGDAIEARRNRIQAIIMDILMPTGNLIDIGEARQGYRTGLVLLKRLKEDSRYATIPVLIFTILSNQEVKEWAARYKVPLLLKQETTPQQLCAAIKDLLV